MSDTETVSVEQEKQQEATQEQPVQEEQSSQASEQVAQQQEVAPEQQEQETQVPLSALHKERRRRQELEEQYRQLETQRQQAAQQEEDQYEPVTKADLGQSKQEIVRTVMETSWIKENPEKAKQVNEKLSEFLKQRPNLKSAIEAAPNRYEEAWELMDKLTPRQKAALQNNPTPKAAAPNSPASVPKAAGINQSLDVMGMSDSEFNAWRASKRRRR